MSTSIIKAVQKEDQKGFCRSYFMKSSWCDTDGRRDRRKMVLVGVAHKEGRLSGHGRREKTGKGYGMIQKRERED